MQQVTTYLRRMLSFTGRAGLKEFWTIYLLLCAVDLALSILIGVKRVEMPFPPGYKLTLLGGQDAAAMGLTFVLWIPLLAAGARRLHDQDRSGWWQLALLIPYFGIICITGIMAAPGTRGPNRHGPDPREKPTRSATA
jgi:uncharacterized membrane protein YhaH (DUF805 family)